MEKQLLIAKYQTINRDVKICVECGSFSLHKENQVAYCKDCERFFQIMGDKN